jgi:CDP-4-dehydro-6-deoxyglucose reductase, E3
MIPSTTFDVRLARARKIAPAVRHLVFERTDGKAFDFVPGQWINLLLPLSSGEIKRAYSIASPPNRTPSFDLAVTHVTGGAGSEYLHSIAEGTILRAIGPHGFFTRAADDSAPSLLIATGTGIAPIRSMVIAAADSGATAPLWVLFGARHEEDILYRAEFEELTRSSPQVRYEVTLSKPHAKWKGRSGYVQRHVPELLGGLIAESRSPPHVFICGLDRMVSAVKSLCRNDLCVERKRVHVEAYD